jgi:hypothetical protein
MAELEPPRERACERCGRRERWDEQSGTWVAAGPDSPSGTPHCVHEWDITANYNPFDEA